MEVVLRKVLHSKLQLGVLWHSSVYLGSWRLFINMFNWLLLLVKFLDYLFTFVTKKKTKRKDNIKNYRKKHIIENIYLFSWNQRETFLLKRIDQFYQIGKVFLGILITLIKSLVNISFFFSVCSLKNSFFWINLTNVCCIDLRLIHIKRHDMLLNTHFQFLRSILTKSFVNLKHCKQINLQLKAATGGVL